MMTVTITIQEHALAGGGRSVDAKANCVGEHATEFEQIFAAVVQRALIQGGREFHRSTGADVYREALRIKTPGAGDGTDGTDRTHGEDEP